MEVAHQIIFEASKKCIEDLTNLKLQKLIYFSNISSMCISGSCLFDDNIQAWDLGPVVSCVYGSYKHYKDSPIKEWNTCTKNIYLKDIVEFVINVFGSKTAGELVNITHCDTTYKTAYENYKKGGSNVMDINKQTAIEIIERETKDDMARAALASLRGKVSIESDIELPEYIDDYKNVSEEERLKIWGLANIDKN